MTLRQFGDLLIQYLTEPSYAKATWMRRGNSIIVQLPDESWFEITIRPLAGKREKP